MRVRIGILTSGGDCPGLNAVIRGAVLKGDRIYEHTFLGIKDGFRGLVEDDIAPLPRRAVRGLSRQGGTILGTSRVGDSYRLRQSAGRRRATAAAEQNQATPDNADPETGEIIP